MAMLSRLKLTNFKSWQEAKVNFGRLTGLFGVNSSGKSSLAQFLLLLKQTREAAGRAPTLELNGRLVRLGVARDVIHAHDESRTIRFEVRFEHEADLFIDDPSVRGGTQLEESRNRAIRAELEYANDTLRAKALTYEAGDAKFSLLPSNGHESAFELEARVPGVDFSFTRTRGRPPILSHPVKTYRFPDQARLNYQNSGFLADLEAAFESALDRLHYLGPLREPPSRDYLWASSRPADVGEKGERTIDAIIAAQDEGRWLNLAPHGRYRPFPEIIAHWLRELNLIESFQVMEIAPGSNRWQVRVQTATGAAEVMLTDVGFGVSQVLPVITLLHYVPEGSTVILEQPEIHLHPLAQAGLADVIINAATHRKVQVILESHSEHLLLRLQRRIAEGKVKADDVALYFCEPHDDGASTIRTLYLDEFGNIQNWPHGFMGDAFTETAEAELARLERMQQAQ